MIFKKIFKFSFTQKFLAYLGYLYILFVGLTSRIEIKNEDFSNKMLKEKKAFILAFWHSQLMMIGYVWKSKSSLNMLASSHSDGRFGAYIAGHFNLKNISIEANNNPFYDSSCINTMSLTFILISFITSALSIGCSAIFLYFLFNLE